MQPGDDDARAASPWAPPDAAPPSAWQQPRPWGQPAWGQPQQWGQQPWGWTPPPPDPRETRRRRRRAILALASVVGLLLATLSAAVVVEQRRESRIRADIAAAVPVLQAFVEQERGLAFRAEVDVEVLDDGAFLDALYEGGEDEPIEEGDSEQTLDALGLIDPDTDLDEEVGDSLDEGVVGFYDPQSGRLAIRGRELDAFAQLVLVHELTHALQDQHFGIDRPDLDEADDERGLAFRSLVEGDAVRVETAWLDTQPADVRQELAEQFGGGGGGGEPVVEAFLGFPYYAGPGLVAALLDDGGQAAVDEAFRTPPTTVEQVVDPDAGDGVDVPAPSVEGEVLDEGVLGILSLALLLETDPLEAGVERAWNGDRYVTVEQDGRTCTTAHIAVDDAESGAALSQALQGWAQTQPDAVVGKGPAGTVELVACGP